MATASRDRPQGAHWVRPSPLTHDARRWSVGWASRYHRGVALFADLVMLGR
ncbi:hypothetical protein ACQEVX_24215 [Streptomyces syringium]|uniref:hypothetical protein n=1 Tax=Streptomyces syringium TaxID=76729 RepID=UPI003D8D81F1